MLLLGIVGEISFRRSWENSSSDIPRTTTLCSKRSRRGAGDVKSVVEGGALEGVASSARFIRLCSMASVQ